GDQRCPVPSWTKAAPLLCKAALLEPLSSARNISDLCNFIGAKAKINLAQVLLKKGQILNYSAMSRSFFDEMRAPDGSVRPHYQAFSDWLSRTAPDKIVQKRDEAERAFHRLGITFAVYGDEGGTERLIP